MNRRTAAESSEPSRSLFGEVAVILPAWQPDERLARLCAELLEAGLGPLVVVDDGSSAACDGLFRQLERTPGIVVCRHPQNRGKGCALKTGFAEALACAGDLAGVVTADADGQHTAKDIVRVAGELAGRADRVVLGTRSFGAGVPWRSKLGNLFTRACFAGLSGRLLRDTQTGLRGLPAALLPRLVKLAGERYEYEMVMLAWLCREHVPTTELGIETVYLDGNRGSHFKPLRDSWRIYGALLRFYGVTLRRSRAGVAADKQGLRAV